MGRARDEHGTTQRLSDMRDIQLPGGGTFKAIAYVRAVSDGGTWIRRNWPRTMHMAQRWRIETAEPVPASETEASVFSFAMQEYEARSMKAKMEMCERYGRLGVKPMSLQHDGLVVARGGVTTEELRSHMQEAVESTLGYSQNVEIKEPGKEAAAIGYKGKVEERRRRGAGEQRCVCV